MARQINCEIKVTQNEITIVIPDASKTFGSSSTGKTQVVATTGGFVRLQCASGEVMLSLNCNKK